MVAGSAGARPYSPNIMTGAGKEETDNAMRIMLEKGAKMLVTNPGAARYSNSRLAGISTGTGLARLID